MAARIDIPLRRNEVWGRTFTLSDNSGAPYDLTGATAQFHVRSRTNNATLVVAGTVDLTDAAFGKFSAILRADEGTALFNYGDSLHVDNLPYDIRLTLPNGIRRAIVAGVIILQRGISHD